MKATEPTPTFATATDLQKILSGLTGFVPDECVEGVVDRVQRLVRENEGMVDEVLRGYERLNRVFEIARQVAHLTRALDVERVVLGQIGALLDAGAVHIFTALGEHREYRDGQQCSGEFDPRVPDNVLDRQVDHTRATRKVAVATLAGGQLVTGALTRLEEQVDVVAVFRPDCAHVIESGDLLMLESLLSFGSHTIANCELHEKLSRMSFEITRALVAAIDKKDPYTSGHSERVGFLCRLIGARLGLGAADLQVLEWSGLLHDVGKIGIPEEILMKPGKLTAEEFEVIKRHPRMGFEILRPIASFESVLGAVLYHHECPDGSGYPEGLKGPEIPLFAGVIHVADIFDALTSNRAYRSAFSMARAFEILRTDSGAKVDARIAAAFLDAFENFRAFNRGQFEALFPHLAKDRSADGAAGDAPAVAAPLNAATPAAAPPARTEGGS